MRLATDSFATLPRQAYRDPGTRKVAVPPAILASAFLVEGSPHLRPDTTGRLL